MLQRAEQPEPCNTHSQLRSNKAMHKARSCQLAVQELTSKLSTPQPAVELATPQAITAAIVQGHSRNGDPLHERAFGQPTPRTRLSTSQSTQPCVHRPTNDSLMSELGQSFRQLFTILLSWLVRATPSA